MNRLPLEPEARLSPNGEELFQQTVALIRAYGEAEAEHAMTQHKEITHHQLEEGRIQAQTLQLNLSEAENRLQQLGDKLRNVESQNQALESQLNLAQQTQITHDERMNRVEKLYAESQAALELKEKELKTLTLQMTNTHKFQMEELETSHSQSAKSARVQAEQQFRQLQDELETHKSDKHRTNQAFEESKRREQQLQLQLQELTSKVNRAEEQLVYLQKDYRELEEKYKAQEAATSLQTSSLQDYKSKFETMQNMNEKYSSEQAQNKSIISHLEEELEYARAETTRLRQKFKTLQADLESNSLSG